MPYSFPLDSYLAFFPECYPPSYSSGSETQLGPVICLIFIFFYHYGHLPWLTSLNPYLFVRNLFFWSEISRCVLWNESKFIRICREAKGSFRLKAMEALAVNLWGWQGVSGVVCPTDMFQPSLPNDGWQLRRTQVSEDARDKGGNLVKECILCARRLCI